MLFRCFLFGLTLVLGACAHRGGDGTRRVRASAGALIARGDLDAAADELRFAIASNPADLKAHLMLARLQLRRGRPGAALRHFEVAHRNDRLGKEDRERLGRLYVERARERLQRGDGAAFRDVEAAAHLGAGPVDERLRGDAYLLAALSALRRGHRDEAEELGRKASKYVAADPRLAFLTPANASAEDLGAAAAWAYDGSAKRAALDLLNLYVERGGREAAVLGRFLAARRWWGGAGARPGPLLLDEIAAAGVSLCSVASEPLALGCARSLLDSARDAAAAEELRLRAEHLFWRVDHAEAAGAWAAITLRAWLDGRADSWFGALTRRVDVDTLMARVAAGDLPQFAAATLLRAAGRPDEAAAALDLAVAAAAGLRPLERAVVLAEAALQGRDAEVIDGLLAAGEVHSLAWRMAALDARARYLDAGTGTAARWTRLVQGAADRDLARRFLRRAGELGTLVWAWPGDAETADKHAYLRWSQTLRSEALAPGRDTLVERWRMAFAPAAHRRDVDRTTAVARFGMPDPRALHGTVAANPPIWADLAAISRAYTREPSAADRLAEAFVDGAVDIGTRAPLVAKLFARLGDPARALKWWQTVSDYSPKHPAYLFALGDAAAAVGDASRAQLHFVAAASQSGDPGLTSLRAARSLLGHGQAVEALAAGRRALHHTAPGEEFVVLETIAAANDALGRSADAAAARQRALERVPAAFRDAAHGTWRGRRDRIIGGTATDLIAASHYPADAGLGVARARALLARGDRAGALAALRTVIAWNPSAVDARVELVGQLAGDRTQVAAIAAELLAVYVGGSLQLSSARGALEALAAVFDGLGAEATASAARAELRALL